MASIRSHIVPSACSNCRIRKIRCDKTCPCSSCRTAGIVCTTNSSRSSTILKRRHDGQPKSPETTAQIHSTAGDPLTQVMQRLDAMESSIRLLPHSHVAQAIRLVEVNQNSPGNLASHVVHEGENFFGIQLLEVEEITRIALANTSASSPDVRVQSALDGFQSALNTPSSDRRATCEHSINRGECVDLGLRKLQDTHLPVDIAMLIFRHFKAVTAAKGSLAFLTFPMRNRTLISTYCQKAYFSDSSPTPGDVIVLHGLFRLILQELKDYGDGVLTEEQYESYLQICAKVVDDGVLSTSILTQASHEHVEALMLGILKAYESSDYDLCAILVTTAARHCLTLGYNRARLRTGTNPEELNRQNELFWMIYVFDKNLTLNRGRAPSIPENDVDIDLPVISADPQLRPWDISSTAYINLARIQGRIYDDLYSAASLKQSISAREASVEVLAAEIHHWRHDFSGIESSSARRRDLFMASVASSNAVVFALLTVVYRALSLTRNEFEPDPRCYASAQSCLKEHIKYMRQCAGDTSGIFSGYTKAIVLWASFTPFVVVFIHAVLRRSHEDVALLKSISQAITSNSISSSNALEILSIRCRACTDLAEALLSFQSLPWSDPEAGSGDMNSHVDKENNLSVTTRKNLHPKWPSIIETDVSGSGRAIRRSETPLSAYSAHAVAPVPTEDLEISRPSWYDIPNDIFRNWKENQQPMMDVLDSCFDFAAFDVAQERV